jgi:hypothetical protein
MLNQMNSGQSQLLSSSRWRSDSHAFEHCGAGFLSLGQDGFRPEPREGGQWDYPGQPFKESTETI